MTDEKKEDPVPPREDSVLPKREVPMPMSLHDLLAKYRCTYSEIPPEGWAEWAEFDRSRALRAMAAARILK